jgi:hypothetical protein
VYTTFPFGVITYREMYLLARDAYSDFFVPEVKCESKEESLNCEDANNAGLSLTKLDGKYEMSWGHAD